MTQQRRIQQDKKLKDAKRQMLGRCFNKVVGVPWYITE